MRVHCGEYHRKCALLLFAYEAYHSINDFVCYCRDDILRLCNVLNENDAIKILRFAYHFRV